jgi:hypothetical protein
MQAKWVHGMGSIRAAGKSVQKSAWEFHIKAAGK